MCFTFNFVSGDVSGIQMQVIPQTQFMPLSDALCSIIMELNLRHVVATLELIWEKLKVWYKEMTPPPQPMVIETLGNLIRDRKVFHSGKFVDVWASVSKC